MGLQQTIRRILREESEIPLPLRRRVNIGWLDNEFLVSLNMASERYLEKRVKFNRITPNTFSNMVISRLIEEICYDNFEICEDSANLYNNIWDFLTEHYSEQIIDRFNEIKYGNIKESILREESEIPASVRRRLRLDKVLNLMKKNSLRYFKGNTKNSIFDASALETAKDILPWHDEQGSDYDDDDYQKWLGIVTEYIIKNYGKETMEYFDKVLPQGSYDNDGNKYIFTKHSEINGGNGFSESYYTWGDLILGRGWLFPINWWEVKEKLDNIDKGRVVFLKPGDEHNDMGYYFSIHKNKIGIKESITSVLSEESESIDKDMTQIIEMILNTSFVIPNKDFVCGVQVKHPDDRKVLQGQQKYKQYGIIITFNIKSMMDYVSDTLMDQAWNIVYDILEIPCDIFRKYVKDCSEYGKPIQ